MSKINTKTLKIILCFVAFFLISSFASAGTSPRKPKSVGKKVENTIFRGKEDRERSSVVSTPSSDVFAGNSRESERVTQVLLGDEFRVTKEDKGWAYGYIPSQKGYRGWIRKDDISFTPAAYSAKDKPFVRVKNARARITFRDGSFINVYAGTRLPFLGKDNRRYEVVVPDGSTGYLPAEAVLVESELAAKEITAEDILQASKFHGSDYRWGGITSGGMDCSGFVYTAFRLNGIYLKRDSYLQAEEGTDVPLAELKAGDLVFFKSAKASRITHVGIYIGNGNFIHSSQGKKGVAVSSLSDEHFKNNFAGARRVLNGPYGAIEGTKAGERTPGPRDKRET